MEGMNTAELQDYKAEIIDNNIRKIILMTEDCKTVEEVRAKLEQLLTK